jgi:hypothetical protein
MPGPGPVPGEELIIYDSSELYWNIVPPKGDLTVPTLTFTAVDGTKIVINRQTGAIIP